MKKIVLFLMMVMIMISQVVFSQEVDHEKVEADGYGVITKGAYWSKRPEAKLVYEGQTPEGVDEVIILQSDHFVRFVKGEHNNYDINYIVFPKGEKIYRKGNEYFAAICGNKIKTWRPVEKIVEKTVEKESLSLADNNKRNTLIDYGNKKKLEDAAKAHDDSIAAVIAKAKKNATPAAKTKTKFLKRKGVKIAGIIILVGGTEELIRNFLVPWIFPKKVVVIQQQEEDFNPVDALPQAIQRK